MALEDCLLPPRCLRPRARPRNANLRSANRFRNDPLKYGALWTFLCGAVLGEERRADAGMSYHAICGRCGLEAESDQHLPYGCPGNDYIDDPTIRRKAYSCELAKAGPQCLF